VRLTQTKPKLAGSTIQQTSDIDTTSLSSRQTKPDVTTYCTALLHLCCVNSLKGLVESLRSHNVECALHY